MALKNTQIGAYQVQREPKYHELKLLEIISERHPSFTGNVLDIACASGAFIQLMNASYPQAHYTGFDISLDLINLAKSRFSKVSNIEFDTGDALSYVPSKKFDLVIASGVLGIFEKFEEPLEKWLSWLGSKGELCVFGCFNSKDVDTIVKFRNNFNKGEWEGGLTCYSINTISKFLDAKGYVYEFIKFELPISLPESDDPIRSYTKMTVDGERLILNGANILTEFYYLIIKRK